MKKIYFTIFLIMIGCTNPIEENAIAVSRAPSTQTPLPATKTPPAVSDTALSPISVPTITPSFTPTITPTVLPISELSSKNLAGIIVVEREPGFAGRRVLFVRKPDGEITLIDNFSSVSGLAWSPDGQKLVFSAYGLDAYAYKAYIANADGSSPVRIVIDLIGGAHRFSPSWSPDGSEMVFNQRGDIQSYIQIMNIDGSNVRLLTEGISPAWSPNGETIIFYKPLTDKIQDIGYLFSIGVDGNYLSQLTEDVYASSPAWSHDGKMIAFWGYEDDGENPGIYVMDFNGDNLRYLTPIGEKPSWLPESSQILVAEDGKLFVVSLDGSVQDFPNDNLSDYYFLYAAVQP